MTSIHGTVLDVMGAGLLLRGPSGIGKSDLALRLLDSGGNPKIRLIADDQVNLEKQHGELIASAPASLFGILEVRGVGLIKVDACKSVPLRLIVDLVERCDIERLPDFAQNRIALMGIKIPCLDLHPFEASAPAKLKIVMGLLRNPENRFTLFSEAL